MHELPQNVLRAIDTTGASPVAESVSDIVTGIQTYPHSFDLVDILGLSVEHYANMDEFNMDCEKPTMVGKRHLFCAKTEVYKAVKRGVTAQFSYFSDSYLGDFNNQLSEELGKYTNEQLYECSGFDLEKMAALVRAFDDYKRTLAQRTSTAAKEVKTLIEDSASKVEAGHLKSEAARKTMGEATGCKWMDGWQQYLRGPMDAEHPYAVPGRAQRLTGLPPALILTGGDDPMRDEALAYAERLRGAGIAVHSGVLPSTTGWPDSLSEQPAQECPCAVEVREHFRAFFQAATPPPPS